MNDIDDSDAIGAILFVDQIKNYAFYGVGLIVLAYLLSTSEELSFLYWLAVIGTVLVCLVCLTSLIQSIVSFFMMLLTFPIYFQKGENIQQRLLVDAAIVLALIINFGLSLTAYQLLADKTNWGLPFLEPLGLNVLGLG